MLNTWKEHLKTVRSTLKHLYVLILVFDVPGCRHVMENNCWGRSTIITCHLFRIRGQNTVVWLIKGVHLWNIRMAASFWTGQRSIFRTHQSQIWRLYSVSLVTYLLTVHLICTNSVVFFCKSLVKPSSSIVSGCHWSGPSTSSTKIPCDDEWTLYLESVCVAGRRDSMKAAGSPAGGGILSSCCAAPTSVDRRRVCEQLHNCGAFLSDSIDPTVIISPELMGSTHTLKIG